MAGGRIFPIYPDGYVVVAGHVPWARDNLQALLACICAFALARRVVVAVAPALGRRLGGALHGPKWRAPGGAGGSVDWARFGAEAYYALVHLGFCAAVVLSPALRADVLRGLTHGATLWEVLQPAMGASLRAYLLAQIGYNAESSVALLLSAARGGEAQRDRAMLAHHAATMALLAIMWRWHFVRVGALVSALHDATDLPIDGIRLAQALGWSSALCAPRGVRAARVRSLV